MNPIIALYLQCFFEDELIMLKNHVANTYGFEFILSKRKDGKGTILKLQKTADVYRFLQFTANQISMESMRYKFDWDIRFKQESEKYKTLYPGYEVVAAHSNNVRPYTSEEIERMLILKDEGETDLRIAEVLGRSYWSVVYKLAELRKTKRRPPKKSS